MRKAIALTVCLCLLLGLWGCGSTAPRAPVETRAFTDSCGRTVMVPVTIERVVPSGSYAQIILYTLCPEKLQSLSTPLTRIQKRYWGEEMQKLPVTGQFYGGGSTVNYEELISAAPDIIIDMGEAKETVRGDMDELQARTGIPTVFICAELDCMAEAYEMLGELLGVETQALACAAYIRETLAEAEAAGAKLPESQRRRVLYAQGEYGTEVLGRGSLHAQVLDYAAAVNVAEIDGVTSKGGNEVSMEQIYLWDPEVVILAPDANYDEVFSDPLWASLSAVQAGQVYEAPMGPFNWMDQPPSVQRVLAIRWLGNLLYPEVFAYDMVAETQRFYQLFWHTALTETEARELLQNSTRQFQQP